MARHDTIDGGSDRKRAVVIDARGTASGDFAFAGCSLVTMMRDRQHALDNNKMASVPTLFLLELTIHDYSKQAVDINIRSEGHYCN